MTSAQENRAADAARLFRIFCFLGILTLLIFIGGLVFNLRAGIQVFRQISTWLDNDNLKKEGYSCTLVRYCSPHLAQDNLSTIWISGGDSP
jgi:hypothetical protein